jgi:hypothetical protein
MATKNHTAGSGIATTYTVNSWDDNPEVTPSALTLIDKQEVFYQKAMALPPEYLILSEMALEEEIRERKGGKFDKTLGMLKIAFWDEYSRAIHTKTSIKIPHVWRPLVSESYWKMNVLENKLNLAWLIHPFADENVVQREMLALGFKRLREALELPLLEKYNVVDTDEEGNRRKVILERPNVALLKEMHNIVKTLQDRVYGAVTQHHQVVSKNLNLNLAAGPQPAEPPKPVNPKVNEALKGASKPAALPVVSLDSAAITLEQLEAYEKKLLSIEDRIADIVERAEDIKVIDAEAN